ncbi:MAG: hypothetical protein IPH95_11100 [Candidatus Promineofilum sp.]|nr:hypothetical protein [Promineifilum sp.]
MTDAFNLLLADLPREALAEFSRRNRIRRLNLFGSALRAVDLNTLGFLSPYFRDQVMTEVEDLYVAP